VMLFWFDSFFFLVRSVAGSNFQAALDVEQDDKGNRGERDGATRGEGVCAPKLGSKKKQHNRDWLTMFGIHVNIKQMIIREMHDQDKHTETFWTACFG
jgi:hypothetical protein